MFQQSTLTIKTRGRGTYDLTREVAACVAASGLTVGLCHLFLQHTSASLILCENADASVRGDLEQIFGSLIPDGDPGYRHDSEGPDDMAAHARTVLTQNDLCLPIRQGRLGLGTWQGLYLWEHRTQPHRRDLIVTLQGEGPGPR